MYYPEIEENGCYKQRGNDGEYKHVHCNILLRADYVSCFHVLALEFLASKPYGILDYGPRLDDAYDARHGNAADADVSSLVGENLFGRKRCVFGAHAQERDYHEPYKCRACKDDEAILQPDNVAQPEHGGLCVYLEHHLGIGGKFVAPRDNLGRKHVAPPAECRKQEVIYTADKSSHHKRASLVAAFLARN